MENAGNMCRANEICRESKRQTINADDVFKAVEELDFPEFSEPLMRCLAGQSAHSMSIFHTFTMPRISTHIIVIPF